MDRRYITVMKPVRIPVKWTFSKPARRITAKRKTPKDRLLIKERRRQARELWHKLGLDRMEWPDKDSKVFEQMMEQMKEPEGREIIFIRHVPIEGGIQ